MTSETSRFANSPGKRIKLLRQDMGMTQGELVERLLNDEGVEVGQSYISEIERSDQVKTLPNGKRVYWLPGGNLLNALAGVLHTTTDYICMRTDDPNLPTRADEESLVVPLTDPAMRRELERLTTLYMSASPEHKQALMQFLQAFTVRT